jgi:hypothetical protein
MKECELKELEEIERSIGSKFKHFKGKNKNIMESKFQKYIDEHKDIRISILICRKRSYSLWYD